MCKHIFLHCPFQSYIEIHLRKDLQTNHQNKDVLIFETSDMITDSDHGVNLAICLTGKMFKQGLLKTDDVNFYTLKQI